MTALICININSIISDNLAGDDFGDDSSASLFRVRESNPNLTTNIITVGTPIIPSKDPVGRKKAETIERVKAFIMSELPGICLLTKIIHLSQFH